jgi:hypothetical protein
MPSDSPSSPATYRWRFANPGNLENSSKRRLTQSIEGGHRFIERSALIRDYALAASNILQQMVKYD